MDNKYSREDYPKPAGKPKLAPMVKMKLKKKVKKSKYDPQKDVNMQKLEDTTGTAGQKLQGMTKEKFEANRKTYNNMVQRRDEARKSGNKKMEKYWQSQVNRYKTVK